MNSSRWVPSSETGEPVRKRLYPLVTEFAVDRVPVTVTYRVLKLARRPYYRWLSDPITEAEVAGTPRRVYVGAAREDQQDHRPGPGMGAR